jgi:hypothetical protein
MSLRFSSALVLALSLASGLACSAGSSDPAVIGRPPGQTGGAGNITGSGGSGSSLVVGSGNSGNTTGPDPNDKRDIPMREKICDAAGKCTCLHLAMLGTLTSAADDPDTTAFTDWLSAKSEGSATATNIPTKPAVIDAAFLANYDILLVANVNGWTFSADEKAAVQKWVEDGGGVITLTGFTSTATEAAATSQLISFAGLSYSGTSAAQYAAPDAGEKVPVYYKGGTVDLKLCMDWRGGVATKAAQPFVTTPINFTPQTDTLEKLTANLDYVGAFIGWPITAPADAKVVAKDPVNGGNMAVAKEVNGKGRIFAFGDEWVTFTNLWEQKGTPTNSTADMYNKCWVAPSGSAAAFFHSVQTLYQTKQFWFNAINWVAPPNGCFTIVDPDVITVVK